MNVKQQALERVSNAARNMYAVFEECGPQPTGFFKQDRLLANGRQWKWNRPPYPTDERRELEREGLIRPLQKRTKTNARIYEITPLDGIGAQKKKWQRNEAAAQKTENQRRDKPTLRGISSRIAAYRQQEKQFGTLSRARWIERRRRILELTVELRRIEPMLFWKVVEKDELEQVYEELVAMRVLADDLLASLDLTRTDKETRALIAQLRNINGRSEIEAAPYLRKADELEERLNYG